MPEVLVRFTQEITGTDGRSYMAQACGSASRERANAWIGWIEFLSALGAARTGRETTQPNHDALTYWAQGLTQTYLQGALSRALGSEVPDLAPRSVQLEPVFDCPADDRPARGSGIAAPSGAARSLTR